MLTIIVPLYNVERFISKLISTLNAQSYKDFYVIFVNDGSTDNTRSFLEYEINNSNVFYKYKIIDKENGGLSDARNCGLKLIETKYVTFLDPDDYLSKNYYESLIEGMLEYKCEVGISSYIEEWPDKKVERMFETKVVSVFNEPDVIWKYTWSACTKVFESKLFLDERFDKDLYHEDLALIPNIISNANNVFICKESIYFYYRRNDSISGSKNLKKEFDIITAFRNLRSRSSDKMNKQIIEPLMIKTLLFSFLPNLYDKYSKKDKLTLYLAVKNELVNIDYDSTPLFYKLSSYLFNKKPEIFTWFVRYLHRLLRR